MEKSLALQHPMTKRDPAASGAIGLDCVPPNGLTPPPGCPLVPRPPPNQILLQTLQPCLPLTHLVDLFLLPRLHADTAGSLGARTSPHCHPLGPGHHQVLSAVSPPSCHLLLAALCPAGHAPPWFHTSRGPRGEDHRPTPPAWPRLPCPTCHRPSAWNVVPPSYASSTPSHHTSPNLNGCRPPPTRLGSRLNRRAVNHCRHILTAATLV